MNIALIIAGGVGSRMGQSIPKQFLNIFDKPVIIYTLEAFQHHPDIDEIYVVCLAGWHETLKAYANQFKIKKLCKIVDGGSTGQESIRNGVNEIYETHNANDLIIIHDGVRPLVEDYVLTDVIVKARQYGNAVSSLPFYEQIFVKLDEISSNKFIPRDMLQRVVTPQAYNLGKLKWAYDKAFSENIGIEGSSYTNTMMVELGEILYFACGSEKNIKLTTKENIEIFKAYLQIEKGFYK